MEIRNIPIITPKLQCGQQVLASLLGMIETFGNQITHIIIRIFKKLVKNKKVPGYTAVDNGQEWIQPLK